MTFDREPDLDNANVGTPDNRRAYADVAILGCIRFLIATLILSSSSEKRGQYEKT